MEDEIAVKYHPEKNPNGYVVDGAPLRDIPVGEWVNLPVQVWRSVEAAEFYEVLPAGHPNPKPKKADKKAKDGE